MGAHEALEDTLASVEYDLRIRAAHLVAQYDAHQHSVFQGPGYMTHDEWLAWEGTASEILRAVARG